MSVRARGLFAVWILLACHSAPRVHAADERATIARARGHFERGQRLFNVSRYRDALEEFKEAFVVKADPVFLFNIAQCHRLLGESADAITFYQRYLRAVPDSPNRAEVERRIRELKSAPAAPGTAPPPAAPVVPAPVNASPEPAPVTPRASSVALTRRPRTETGPTVTVPEAAITGRVPDEGESTPLHGRWWFWTGVATVVAGGVTAAVLLSRADRRPRDCGNADLDVCLIGL